MNIVKFLKDKTVTTTQDEEIVENTNMNEEIMKVYISGKITGLEPKEAEKNFHYYSKHIKTLGHIPVNPLDVLPFDAKYTWQDYMREDIKALMSCDCVYAMPNYKQSKGASIEVSLALMLDIPVYEELGSLAIV